MRAAKWPGFPVHVDRWTTCHKNKLMAFHSPKLLWFGKIIGNSKHLQKHPWIYLGIQTASTAREFSARKRPPAMDHRREARKGLWTKKFWCFGWNMFFSAIGFDNIWRDCLANKCLLCSVLFSTIQKKEKHQNPSGYPPLNRWRVRGWRVVQPPINKSPPAFVSELSPQEYYIYIYMYVYI